MATILREPNITFTCDTCRALCAAEAHEFQPLNTMPPLWRIQCPNCRSSVTCQPTVLLSRDINENFGGYLSDYFYKRS